VGRRAVGTPAFRGQIWLADAGVGEAKRFVIVSNNQRNERLADVLGARLTTAPKPSIPSVAEFAAGEISESASRVVADDIVPIKKRFLIRQDGALTSGQMRRVEDALRNALALG